MTVYESALPGVGKKFEIELGDDDQLVVVIHNTGKREVFYKQTPEQDGEKLFELSDRLARTVGSIIEGAHFQPIESDRVETMLGDENLLEWYKIGPDSILDGQTLADARLRERTGVSVVAIDREGELFPSPDPDAQIEVDDTLVIIGSHEDIEAFESMLEGDDSDQ